MDILFCAALSPGNTTQTKMKEMYQLHPQLAADTITLGRSALCDILLMNNSQFPWLILVPRRQGITELYELSAADQRTLSSEIPNIGKALMQHFSGDKFNMGALGNLVAQLHVHLIVRNHDDSAWPQPVWGMLAHRPTAPTRSEKSCPTYKRC